MKRPLLAFLAAAILVLPASAQNPPEPAPPADETADPAAAAAEPEKKDEKPKWDVNNPPGPSYDVDIDTTDGTWMSVDVSPDGKEIVFDLLGDLYTMPIGGGEAKALTTGIAWDMQPRYSPNGKWIAFTSDRGGGDNVWVMNRDGSNPKQVTKETFRLLNSRPGRPTASTSWRASTSPPSARSAPARCGSTTARGGDGLQLTKKRNDQKDAGEPAFSPDGRYLYFSQDATPGAIFEYNKDPNGQIYVIQRLDRETRRDRALRHRPGRLDPADAVAGRQVARLRPPRALQDGALRAWTSSRDARRRSTTGSTATCRRPGRSTASIRRWPGRRTPSRSSSGPAARSTASTWPRSRSPTSRST